MTASGIAQLNERADKRRSLKMADRLDGFKRLFQLCDWSALEFYDDGRLVRLGTPDEDGINFMFVPEQHRKGDYFPVVDVVASAGDGIAKSTSFTVSVLEKLINTPVTEQNYKLLCAFVEMMDIPQGQELIENWQKMFEK